MWKIIQVFSIALFILPLTEAVTDIPDSCRHVVHFHLPSTENYFSLVSSIVQVHIVPTTVFVHIIPNPTAYDGYWDPRALCVVHSIISEYKDVVRLAVNVFYNILRQGLSEYEHYYAFGIMEEKDDPKDIFQRQFSTHLEGLRLASKVVQNLAFASVDVDFERKPVTRVQQIHSLDRYCTKAWVFCLQPVVQDNDLRSPLPNSPAVTKIAQLLQQWSGKGLNYNGWPLLFGSSPVSVLEDVDLSLGAQLFTWKMSFRDLLHQKGYNYRFPVYRLLLEIAQRINATAAAYVQDSPDPYTTINPLVSLEKYWKYNRDLVVGGQSMNFLYCRDITLQDFTTDSFTSFFIPFDVWTWMLLLASIVCLSLLSAWTVGKVLWLPIFAPLTNQSVEVELQEDKMALLASILFIWLIVGSILCNFYGSFVESLLVVPEQWRAISDFGSLHKAGYSLVLPSDPASKLFSYLKSNNTPFQGVAYIDDLRNGVIYHGSHTAYSKKFLSFLAREPRKALLLEIGDIHSFKTTLERKFPRKRCPAGEKPYGNRHLAWSVWNPNAQVLRSVIHAYYVSGILEFWTGAARSNLDALSERLIVEAFDSSTPPAGRMDSKDMDAGEDAGLQHWQMQLLFCVWVFAAVILPFSVTLGRLYWSRMGRSLMRAELQKTSLNGGRKFNSGGEAATGDIIFVAPHRL